MKIIAKMLPNQVGAFQSVKECCEVILNVSNKINVKIKSSLKSNF